MKRKGDLVVGLSRTPTENEVRFVNLPPAVRRLQAQLTWEAGTEGAFVAALETEITSYFVTPEQSVFCNGLDGKTKVEDAIKVFETPDHALAELWRWSGQPDGEFLMIYRLDPTERGDLSASEVLRIAVSPASRLVGPVVYQDESIDFNVEQWARQRIERSRSHTKGAG